jgi:MoxR-like ATPase
MTLTSISSATALGEPGTVKTSLAEALAEGFGLPLIRLQC